MSVMQCDRVDCDNIMCDLCIEGRWYVCNECAAEFRAIAGEEKKLKAEIGREFARFMTTPKYSSNGGESCTAYEFLYG